MKLGILVAGEINPDLQPSHGLYAPMFDALYRSVDPTVATEAFMVVDGVFPPTPNACDAWVITGSKYGVYDDQPWITPLKSFLCSARMARVPMVGVCFGHQIMAEAFGGRAMKSNKGWGCGVHRYRVLAKPSWMEGADDHFAMHAMHQDQVTALPNDALLLGSSDFCENAMIAYGDPEAPEAISIQPHPEFGRAYAEDLVHLRASITIPDSVADTAIESFGASVDGLAFASWSLCYIDRMTRRSDAA